MSKSAALLRRLKTSARLSAEHHGHTLGNFAQVENTRSMTGLIATATCKKCGRTVTVETEPPANGIHIGGEVVAVGCTPPTPAPVTPEYFTHELKSGYVSYTSASLAAESLGISAYEIDKSAREPFSWSVWTPINPPLT